MASENPLTWYHKTDSDKNNVQHEEFIACSSPLKWVTIFLTCSELRRWVHKKEPDFPAEVSEVGGGAKRQETYRAPELVRYLTTNIKHSSQCILLEKPTWSDAFLPPSRSTPTPRGPSSGFASPPASQRGARSAGSSGLSQQHHVLQPVSSFLSH